MFSDDLYDLGLVTFILVLRVFKVWKDGSTSVPHSKNGEHVHRHSPVKACTFMQGTVF